ncbi:molybdate ABC transporter ATP-binding protein [Bacillus sp. TS-2]|nr:molybdate ABC transporter ATP-binding protein [Bacillus sp. TS-2]
MKVDLRNINWRKNKKTLLDRINWQVKTGEHWAILGLNGSGKTSLLKLITGFEWATEGQVTVLDQKFGQTNIHDLRKRIGWVSTALDERFATRAMDTVLEVVLSGKFASVGIYEEVQESFIDEALELLKQLKMEHFAHATFQHLSQGEKRRTMIARALIVKPELLILDEPCNGLDVYIREQLLETIEEITQLETAPTILYVTHHLEEIVPSISHVLLLHNGQIVAKGNKGDMLNEHNLSKTFQLPVTLQWNYDRPWLQIKK